MRQFRVLVHPDGRCEAVKQGWSWPGFFFGWIWALLKRLWLLAAAVFCGILLLSVFVAASGSVLTSILFNLTTLVLAVLFGLSGNEWREKSLKTRGFDDKGVLAAANPEAARAQYVRGDRPPGL